MKQKTITLFILLALVAAMLLCCAGCGKRPEASSAEQTEKIPDAATPVPAPGEKSVESATVIVDGEDGSTVEAKMGLADDTIEDAGEESKKEPSKPTPTPTPSSKPTPTPTPTPAVTTKPGSTGLEWEKFIALSPEARDAFKDSFPDFDAFYDWMIAAQEEYKNAHPNIEIEPGQNIDLSQLVP